MVQTIANLKDIGANFFRWMITMPQKDPKGAFSFTVYCRWACDRFMGWCCVTFGKTIAKTNHTTALTSLLEHSNHDPVASLPNQPWNMRVDNDPPCVIKLLVEIYWISSVVCQMLDWGFLLEQMTWQFVSGLWRKRVLDGLSSVHGQPLGTGPCETWVEPLGCNGWHTRTLWDFKRQHMQTHGFWCFAIIISALRCVQQWLNITFQSSFGELL